MDIQYLKSVVKYALSAVLSLVLIAYILYHMSGGFETDMETSPAVLTTRESTLTVGVTILRNETVLYSSVSGDINYLFNDGDKVAVNASVAEIYPASAGSEETRKKIIELDRKIRILEASNMSDAEKRTDTASTDKLIRQDLYAILERMDNGSVSDAATVAEDFLIQLNRRRIITRSVTDYNDRIAALKAEKKALSPTLDQAGASVKAPKVGYFYSAVDGYETIFSAADIEGLSYLDFLARLEQEPETFGSTTLGYPVGKLVTDYVWYAACVIDADELHNFETDKNYDVKFPYNDGVGLNMYLYRILSDVDSETAVLVFRTGILPSDFHYLRNQTVQVVQKSYTGYRIPASAVRVVNGAEGVYVLRGSVVEFRRIEPIYEYDGYILVKERDESAPDRGNWLGKNEFVITKGKDLYDGKIVG